MKRKVDFCVVGGGIAGMCAALAAARHGAKTLLIQDRPMLGGNASSEIRMHICGAGGPNRRETGIVEEFFLSNYRYNASASWPVFDSVLLGIADTEPLLELCLNASVHGLEMSGSAIKCVHAWQTTTQENIEVEAKIFADCSGDAVLAPLSRADFRVGREARAEFNESEAPVEGDSHTMGNSLLMQAMERPTPQPFTPFPWAYDYSDPKNRAWLDGRCLDNRVDNFWWIEVGGLGDTIKDTEKNRLELMKIVYGVWDYMKNHAPEREQYANWSLEWVGHLPGKRESRRYIGDHVLTQNEVVSGGLFNDVVAYGGWSIDNHFPEGFYHVGGGTKYTHAPSPFGIPYRCLYSRNVPNLLFAGRDISCTHVAMSATRVMATCGLEGQAIGTAAAIAVKNGIDPRDVGKKHLAELQRTLQDDDCLLPGKPLRETRGPCASAKLSGGETVERLRDGMERDWDDGEHAWNAKPGDAAEFLFADETELHEARIVFDSNLNRGEKNRPQPSAGKSLQGRHFRFLNDSLVAPPDSLVRNFRIDALGADGKWKPVCEVEDNFLRLVKVPLNATARGVRLVPLSTWGAELARTFAFEVK